MPQARGKLTQKSDARARRAQTMDLDAPSAMHPQEARVAQQWPPPYMYRLSLTYSVLLQLRQGGRTSRFPAAFPLQLHEYRLRRECPLHRKPGVLGRARDSERSRRLAVVGFSVAGTAYLRVLLDLRHTLPHRCAVTGSGFKIQPLRSPDIPQHLLAQPAQSPRLELVLVAPSSKGRSCSPKRLTCSSTSSSCRLLPKRNTGRSRPKN